MFIILLTLISVTFYLWFYMFDKYRKNSILDMQALGQKYDISKHKMHVLKYNNEPLISLQKVQSNHGSQEGKE